MIPDDSGEAKDFLGDGQNTVVGVSVRRTQVLGDFATTVIALEEI